MPPLLVKKWMRHAPHVLRILHVVFAFHFLASSVHLVGSGWKLLLATGWNTLVSKSAFPPIFKSEGTQFKSYIAFFNSGLVFKFYGNCFEIGANSRLGNISIMRSLVCVCSARWALTTDCIRRSLALSLVRAVGHTLGWHHVTSAYSSTNEVYSRSM